MDALLRYGRPGRRFDQNPEQMISKSVAPYVLPEDQFNESGGAWATQRPQPEQVALSGPNYFDQFDGLPPADAPPESARPPDAVQVAGGENDVVDRVLGRASDAQAPQGATEAAPAPPQPVAAQQTFQPVAPPPTAAPAAPSPTGPARPTSDWPTYGPTGDVHYQPPEPMVVLPGMKLPAKDVSPSATMRAVQAVGKTASDIAKGLYIESPRAVLRGVLSAADHTAGALNDLADWLDNHVIDSRISLPSSGNPTLDKVGGYIADPLKAIKDGMDATLGYVSPPSSVTGKIIEGTAEFLAGFIPAVRFARAVGMGGAVADTAAALGSTYLTTDPKEGGLSNLVQSVPALQNPITQYLSSDPNDPDSINRLKHGVEMAGGGLLADWIVRGIRFAANAKRAQTAVDALHAQDGALGGQLTDAVNVVGDPSAPLVVVKPPAAKAPMVPSPMESTESRAAAGLQQAADQANPEVPGQVAASGLVQGSKDETAARLVVTAMRDPETGAIPIVTKEAEGAVSPVAVGGNHVYINLGRLGTAEDVKSMMQQVADAFAPEVGAAKRGVQTLEDTAALADKLGMTAEDLIARPKGMAFNAEQVVAANRILTTSAETLWELAERAASPNSTLTDAYNFRRMMGVHHAIQMQVLGLNAEAGRALGALRIARTASGSGMTRQLNEIMDQLGGQQTAQELAQRMMDLRAQGVGEGGLNAATKRGWFAVSQDMVRESFTLGLLWKPKTHLRNLVSNMVAQFQQGYERYAASKIDQLLGTALEDGAVAPGEATAYYMGQIGAVKDMFMLAGRAAARGVGLGERPVAGLLEDFRGKYPDVNVSSSQKFSEKPAAISSAGIGQSRGWLPGDIAAFAETPMGRFVDFYGQAVRVPGYALGAGDFFFKTFGYAGEIRAQALRQASQEGLQGEALVNRIAELTANPPEWMHQAAVDQSLYATFNQRAGDIAQYIMNIRNYDGVVNPTFLMATYIRTPSNILRYTANRTPLAMLSRHWYDDIAAGGARRSLALARMSTGTAVIAAALDYASSGLVTGPGPSDPAQKEALTNTGWQPYSFYIPVLGKYVSYNNADPLTQPFAFAAAVSEMIKRSDLSPEDYDTMEEILGHAVGAVSASVIDKSYFTGIAETISMIEESSKDRAGAVQNWAEKQATGLVPFTSLGGAINQYYDPVSRQPANVWQAIMDPIPGLRERLIPARNVWGKPVEPQAVYGKWFDMISPFNVTKDTGSQVDHELVRLQGGVQRIGWKDSFAGVQVNFHDYPQPLDRYRVLAGNALKLPQYGDLGCKDFLDAVVSGRSPLSEVYNLGSDGPNGGKLAMIKNWVSEYRQAAQLQVLDEARTTWPDFYEYIVGKKVEKVDQKMPVTPDRRPVEAQ